MNLQFYLEKLQNSEQFKNFMKEHPNAFPCSGFFVIDKTGKEGDKQHFDFWIPGNKKLMSFQLENMQLVPLENFGKNLDKISLEQEIDFEKIEKMIVDEMEKQGIKAKIQKILLSFQKLEEKNFLVGTVFVPKLGLIQINIDLQNMKITHFAKKSFISMMNIFGKKK